MAVRIAVIALYVLCCGAELRADRLSADQGDRPGYLAQASGGPPRTGQRPEDASSPSSQGKAQSDQPQKEKPAAPLKADPLKPFEPTEKVKADQAIEFPADI
jgi:hypothetical protein